MIVERGQLENKLGEIEATLPALLAESDDPRDFWSAFADEANHLSRDLKAPEDKEYVRQSLNRMLQELGLMAAPGSSTGDAPHASAER